MSIRGRRDAMQTEGQHTAGTPSTVMCEEQAAYTLSRSKQSAFSQLSRKSLPLWVRKVKSTVKPSPRGQVEACQHGARGAAARGMGTPPLLLDLTPELLAMVASYLPALDFASFARANHAVNTSASSVTHIVGANEVAMRLVAKQKVGNALCARFPKLIVPELAGLEQIGIGAFEGCRALESITLPAGVKCIDGVAFALGGS